MLTRLLPLVLITGLLVAGGVVAALILGGDGGGGDLTVEEYFQRVDAIEDSLTDAFDGLQGQYPEAFADPEQTRGYLDATDTVLADAVERLRELEAPAAVSAAHAELSQATEEVRGAFADLRDQVEGLEDAAALEELLTSSEVTAFDRFATACLAMQDLAAENGITVELNCQ